MPRLHDYLHYRNVDVTTIKELCKRWLPRTFQNRPDKLMTHRALDDIRESIHELKYYKRAIFMASKLYDDDSDDY